MITNFDIKDFLSYILSEKGGSQNTADAYLRDLTRFKVFLLERQVNDLAAVGHSLLYDFLKSMHEEGLSASTRRRHIACLKTFFRFAKREDYIEHNFTQYIETPAFWQELPEILTIQEMTLFLDTSHRKARGIDMRTKNKAICELFYGSGLRVSELIELKVSDISEDNFVKVKGKGNKERIVPMTNHSRLAIEGYWSLKRKDLKPDDPAFTTIRGKKLDRFEIFRMIQRHTIVCGITKKVTPHTFRHSMATHMLDNGADLAILQSILGHENVGSTGRYLHLTTAKLSEKFIKHHPRYAVEETETNIVCFG